MSGLWFVAGLLVGVAVISAINPANTSSCCQRVNAGARDKIAGYTGPLAPATSSLLDSLGLTGQLSGLLDTLGVPTGAAGT